MLKPSRKYRTLILACLLLLVALLLYSTHLRKRPDTSLFHRMVLQLTAPLEGSVRSGVRYLTGLWDGYVWLVGTGEKNRNLQAENRKLQAELTRLVEVRFENQRLKKLLTFREQSNLTALPAQIVAEDASSWFRTQMIDKGATDGVIDGLPVVVAEGVVGRTFQVTTGQARVLLVNDASSAIAATLQNSRSRGVCRGQGDYLLLDYIDHEVDVRVGELLLTSGTGGVFPKGLVIGVVSEIRRADYGLFQTIRIRPSVDFSRLEEVLVLSPGAIE